jgi:hypothetical protein
MEHVVDILKILIPGLLVAGTVYFLINKYLQRENQKRTIEYKIETQKHITPLRLQAYERAVLYLERISPHSIIMRTYKAGMSAKLLQADILKAIREEYEHNMAQQVYISPNSWSMLKQAKEETIKMINLAAMNVPNDAGGQDLAQLIFEALSKMEKLPTDVAINYLKNDIQKSFGV